MNMWQTNQFSEFAPPLLADVERVEQRQKERRNYDLNSNVSGKAEDHRELFHLCWDCHIYTVSPK